MQEPRRTGIFVSNIHNIIFTIKENCIDERFIDPVPLKKKILLNKYAHEEVSTFVNETSAGSE